MTLDRQVRGRHPHRDAAPPPATPPSWPARWASRPCPACDGIIREVKTGDLIALDGREGHVYLNPGPEVEAAYRKLQREYVDLRGRLDREPRPGRRSRADGVAVELLANVNGVADAAMAAAAGAAGVGLYRTEYLFLTHPSVPDEEEQLPPTARSSRRRRTAR